VRGGLCERERERENEKRRERGRSGECSEFWGVSRGVFGGSAWGEEYAEVRKWEECSDK